MKKTLKQYRKLKQLSQQELSDESGISVRTIQRIENNLSSGSSFVIKSLCKALEVEIEDLLINEIYRKNEEEKIVNEKNNYRQKLKLINISSILVILFPLLNLITPYLLFLKFRKLMFTNPDAHKILSFQILWTLSTLLIVIFIPAISQIFFGMLEISGFPLFMWLYLICVVFNVFITIETSIRINESKSILPHVPKLF